MKLIKLTDVCCGDTLYINSNCILSCEHKYHNESNKWYTKVGLLYENAFEFWYVKETIEDIQSQLEGKPRAVKVDNKLVGRQIRKIRREKGMTLEEFSKLLGVGKSVVCSWDVGKSLPRHDNLEKIADLAGMTVQELLEG